MATTTTNFGWDIPQSTDLVKDGATAIAALGQDIDTAFVDLKGGTTGQVLAKASGTDLDFSWTTPSSGASFKGARVYASGTQSFSNASAAAFTWDSESYDTNSFHSTSTNTSRLTVPTTGYYLIASKIMWASNSTTSRISELKKNGTGVSYLETGADDVTALELTDILYATAGDYFELFGYQNSGGTLTTAYGGDVMNYFSIVSLGA